jgi:hypothetical protein
VGREGGCVLNGEHDEQKVAESERTVEVVEKEEEERREEKVR